METQGKPVTHEDLEKLLEFYFNGEMDCSGLTCHRKGGSMDVSQLLKASKDCQPTIEQIDSLRKRLEGDLVLPEKLTNGSLNRKYNL